MDRSPIFPHLDREFLWRACIRDAEGQIVPLSRPYFHLAEAEQAVKVLSKPMAP
jgi:hypothetical protein